MSLSSFRWLPPSIAAGCIFLIVYGRALRAKNYAEQAAAYYMHVAAAQQAEKVMHERLRSGYYGHEPSNDQLQTDYKFEMIRVFENGFDEEDE